MGCKLSSPDRTQPHVFKAKNLNENDKSIRSVYIVVQRTSIIVQTRSGKLMASWPMSCIRRYGCNEEGILFVEAGSGCDTGQGTTCIGHCGPFTDQCASGMYLFKCDQNERIFELLKKFWTELQSDAHIHHPGLIHAPVPANLPSSSQTYVNGFTDSTMSPETNYINGEVQPQSSPLDSSPPARVISASRHNSNLPSLPEEPAPNLGDRPFPLQPAPASRKEMMIRRRINSERPVAYHAASDHVAVAMRPSSVTYENNDVSEAMSQRVLYTKQSDQVTIAPAPRPEPSLASPASVSTGVSFVSLRSDCDALLTPNSKSSGVGSLSGNAPAPPSGNPPPIPPSLCDPWKRHPGKCGKSLFFSPSAPHSARDYVNTTNASLDVSGTPLPATAVGAVHFNFDFDPLGFPRRPGSAGAERSRLNYVPVEVDFSCGGSSASSGIPGTPRTPKTPKTPSIGATEYAVIDHNKTRALSHALSHRARQRERKSRHTSTELAVNGL